VVPVVPAALPVLARGLAAATAVVLTAVVLLVPVLLGRLRLLLVVARVRTRTPVAPVASRTGLVFPVGLPVLGPVVLACRVRAPVGGRVPVAVLVAVVVLVRVVAWGPARVLVPVVVRVRVPVVVRAWVVSVELPGPAVLEAPVAAVVLLVPVRARVRAAGVRKARTISSTRLPTT
jgi:hypothetical protein